MEQTIHDNWFLVRTRQSTSRVRQIFAATDLYDCSWAPCSPQQSGYDALSLPQYRQYFVSLCVCVLYKLYAIRHHPQQNILTTCSQ